MYFNYLYFNYFTTLHILNTLIACMCIITSL